ncbi:MAG: beta-N-acetylhexosaminidase [Gemmatimonadales bacterium]
MRPTSLLLLAGLFGQPVPAQQHNLLPVPASVTMGAGSLTLDSTFTAAITGYREPRLERAVQRAMRRLEARMVVALPRTIGSTAPTKGLIVQVGRASPAVPALDDDESYRLDVTRQTATLTANTVVGAIRGLETFLQLYQQDAGGASLQMATISDAPRFRWRGVLVDAGRHFIPVEVIKRTVDGMAVSKLNVLHWHLSEDQGFRIEVKSFPKLHELGSDGDYYTQAQVKDVVAYAADRGIRVMPEFDMPGHMTAWFAAYPELASGKGPYQIDRKWGVSHPAINPTVESTYRFLDTFIGEMVTLFPDKSWHIGGDEVEPTEWKANPTIQAWMKVNKIADAHALQTHFNRRLFAILKKHGRQPVGWDEILAPDLPTGAVIQSWRGTNYLITAAKQGRQAILSAPYYLDHIKTTTEMYLSDPLPAGHDLTPAQQALVLGGEACMWGEYITQETIDSRLWPRLAGVAERFWSPASVRDVPDMYRRLEVFSRRLEEVGPTHESHTARMVRRFAEGDDAITLVDLLEYARPRGFAGRGTNQFSPLTRLIDAARPDPWNGWRMQLLADQAVQGDARAGAVLADHFRAMQGFTPLLDAMMSRTPMATDGLPVARALNTLGRIGLEALDYRMRKVQPSAGWLASTDSTLKTIEGKTFGLLRPVGAEAVRRLVAPVSSVP